MAWIKEFHTPFDLVDTVYIALALSGLYFVHRRRIGVGRYFYYSEKDNKFVVPSIYILHVLAGLALQWWYIPQLMLYSPYDICLFEIMHMHLSASGIYTIIMQQNRSNLFIKACKIIVDVDKVMSRKNLTAYYALIRKLSCIPFVFPIPYFFVFLNFMQNDFVLSNFWMFLIGQHHCFGAVLAIHTYSHYYFAIFGLMIHQRLQELNQHLQQLKHEKNLRIVEEQLITLATVHSDLCKVWKYTSLVFGWPVTAQHLLSYIFITCFALYMLDVGFQTTGFQMGLFCIWMTSVISCSILAGEFVQRAGVNTGIVLCELMEVDHFFGSNVMMVAKTFHLQLLHNNIQIILCGFFDLSVEHFGEVLRSITNFIMFIIQLKE